jgi:hypothetical protein
MNLGLPIDYFGAHPDAPAAGVRRPDVVCYAPQNQSH